jgi:hypothetical protein
LGTIPVLFLVIDFNIRTQVSALPTFMINVALFMTGFFIAPCDVFMDKMLVAEYWMLDFKKKLSLLYPASACEME